LQDLEILDTREKVWFRVDEETKQAFADTIIPFWTNRSNRDRMMDAMSEEWKDAYAAGIFTEFMEQRAPGHTVAGYKIFQKGMLDIMQDIDDSMSRLDFLNDPQAFDKKEELKGMKIAANALIIFANRHANKLEELAAVEADEARKAELLEMARVCRRVPAHAPSLFSMTISKNDQGIGSDFHPLQFFLFIKSLRIVQKIKSGHAIVNILHNV
jgi:formate C-acetyltransferase